MASSLSDIIQGEQLELGRFTQEELAIIDGTVHGDEATAVEEAGRGALTAAYRSLLARDLLAPVGEDGYVPKGELAVISSFWNERDRVAQLHLGDDPSFVARNLFLTPDGWVLEDGIDAAAVHSFVVRSLDAEITEVIGLMADLAHGDDPQDRAAFTLTAQTEDPTSLSTEVQRLIDSAVAFSTLDVARPESEGYWRVLVTILDRGSEGLWLMAPTPGDDPPDRPPQVDVVPLERKRLIEVVRSCLELSASLEPSDSEGPAA